jgi:hypothetical protein
MKGNENNISERQLELAVNGLDRVSRRIPFDIDPGLPAIVGELLEWLDDDRQWFAGFAAQWKSLLQDVLRARDLAGPHLRRQLSTAEPAWKELSQLRASLGGGSGTGAPEPSVRRRLRIAGGKIKVELLKPATLGAAFEDLLTADEHLAAQRRAIQLEALAEMQGLDTVSLLKELRRLLEDDRAAVKAARGEKLESGDLGSYAGFNPADRVRLAHDRLQGRPRKAEVVVWLEYTLAPLEAGRIELGDGISLYAADWIRKAVAAGRTDELPPEVHDTSSNSNLLLLIGLETGAEATRDTAGTEIPEALVRVDLGEVETDQALQLAREAAELVVALAVLQGSDPVLWQPTGSYIRLFDGREAGATFHASPVPALSFTHRDALRSDSMPEFSEGLGAALGAHLPVRDVRLRRAARLALWLRRSRETWEPGRVILVGRVLEQIAGWAGVRDRHRFEEEYLRLSWALRRVRLEVSNCWRGVWAAHMNGDLALREGAWEEITSDASIGYEETEGGRYVFNLAGVMEQTDFLIERLMPGSAPHERLSKLADRTVDGVSTASWISDLENEFGVLKSRERRIRNALVHGGAVDDAIAGSVLLFVDWLAADALHAAIEGILEGGNLIDYFIDFRAKRETCRERLQRNDHPSQALFWEAD